MSMPLTKQPKKKKHTKDRPIQVSFPYDLELAVMEVISDETGYQWDVSEIAAVCGITRQAAFHIQKTALKNVRSLLADEIREMQTVFPYIA